MYYLAIYNLQFFLQKLIKLKQVPIYNLFAKLNKLKQVTIYYFVCKALLAFVLSTPFPRAEGSPMLITSEYVPRQGLGALFLLLYIPMPIGIEQFCEVVNLLLKFTTAVGICYEHTVTGCLDNLLC